MCNVIGRIQGRGKGRVSTRHASNQLLRLRVGGPASGSLSLAVALVNLTDQLHDGQSCEDPWQRIERRENRGLKQKKHLARNSSGVETRDRPRLPLLPGRTRTGRRARRIRRRNIGTMRILRAAGLGFIVAAHSAVAFVSSPLTFASRPSCASGLRAARGTLEAGDTVTIIGASSPVGRLLAQDLLKDGRFRVRLIANNPTVSVEVRDCVHACFECLLPCVGVLSPVCACNPFQRLCESFALAYEHIYLTTLFSSLMGSPPGPISQQTSFRHTLRRKYTLETSPRTLTTATTWACSQLPTQPKALRGRVCRCPSCPRAGSDGTLLPWSSQKERRASHQCAGCMDCRLKVLTVVAFKMCSAACRTVMPRGSST